MKPKPSESDDEVSKCPIIFCIFNSVTKFRHLFLNPTESSPYCQRATKSSEKGERKKSLM